MAEKSRAAVVVLTNEDAADASGAIARKIAPLLFPQEDAAPEEQKARDVFASLQQGKINRALFTDNANSYFDEQALRDLRTGLAPLGEPQSFKQTTRAERGGMTLRVFAVKFPKQTLEVVQRAMLDGKLEQYQIIAAE
jgi:hypothetical protein